jgi:hypothetical protein
MTELPSQIVAGASLAGNEYGWSIASFPEALRNAVALQYACIGGQFQFRIDNGTCEMYWLNADASDQNADEPWAEYCNRSCAEVLQRFQQVVATTDFRKEALNWPILKAKVDAGFDIESSVVFVAYFVEESESLSLCKTPLKEQE